jgi:hypothetical protein
MDILSIVEKQLEAIYRELDRQTMQMARFQAQVDELRARARESARHAPRRDPDDPRGRSYARRQGDYLYDIEVHEASPDEQAGHFYAKAVNMVQLAPPGQPVSVNPDFPREYGATRDEALSNIEAAVAQWVKGRT